MRFGQQAYMEYRSNQRASAQKGSVTQAVLNQVNKCSVVVLTVDSMLSGAVTSRTMDDWYNPTMWGNVSEPVAVPHAHK